MTRELPQLRSAWSFPLIEREREYRLTARLFRSRLVIEDERGNKIAVSKRSRDIKIKRWGNSNIFTYSGQLFDNFKLIVIGANSIEQAQDLIIFVYLSEVLAQKAKIFFNNTEKVEEVIKKEIIEGLLKGFPFSKSVEKDLQDHIEKIIKTDLGTPI